MLGDVLLVSKIKNGNVNAFKEVFTIYYAPLCMFASCIVKDTNDAEEIVQELFYVIWKNRNNLPLLHSLKGYLYNAVRNQSLLFVEHRNVVRTYASTEKERMSGDRWNTNPQAEMETAELEDLVNKSLNTLSERCRTIFLMHRMESCKYSEIADRLGVSVKTVEADITKALKTLKAEINRYFNS
jgi:RNA polymerase sigma-70 factor (ECF subfamily)